MGDVMVENPSNMAMPHKRQPPTNSIPAIDSLEGLGNDETDEYSTMKKLQRHLEYVHRWTMWGGLFDLTDHRYINLQEEYIKDEQR